MQTKDHMYTRTYIHMGGCQNYGPFLGTLNVRCRIIIGTQKGTIILITTYIYTQTENPMHAGYPSKLSIPYTTAVWALYMPFYNPHVNTI